MLVITDETANIWWDPEAKKLPTFNNTREMNIPFSITQQWIASFLLKISIYSIQSGLAFSHCHAY